MNKKKETLTLVRDGECKYKIRISKPMEPVSNELEVARAVQELIRDITDVTPEIDTATPDNEVPYEILIGKTCRENEHFIVDRDGMDGADFDIVLCNRKIAFAAVTDEGLWECAARFAADYLGYHTDTMVAVKKSKNLSLSLPVFTERGNGDLPYTDMLSDNVRESVGVSDGPVCFSSPAVYERLLAYARSMAPSRHRKVRLVSNSAVKPCSCEACTKAAEEEGTPSGAFFRTVAKIARELLPLWPQQRIQTVAYMETLTPPQLTVFPENVDVLVCEPRLCSGQAVNSPSCKKNRAFARTLKKWTSIACVQVLDFTSDYYYYPAPFPNYFTVRENVRYYASIGVSGCYLQWNTVQAGLEFGPVRKKLYRALLADPNMSAEAYADHLKSALRRIYGYDKADDLYAYMELMASAASSDYTVTSRPAQVVPVKVTLEKGGRRIYDLTVMTQAYRLWDRVHPYREAIARSQVYLSQMLFNRYQSLPEAHAFVQFSEWFTDTIDNFDKTDVLNILFESTRLEN